MSTIRFFFILLSLMLLQLKMIVSQTNNIIIDSLSSEIYINNFPDTLVSSYDEWGCGTHDYSLDIDSNMVPDFIFTVQCYMGGMGATSQMVLSSYDNCLFVVDTNVLDTMGHMEPPCIYYPAIYSMVKIFEYNDTIDEEEYYLENENYILNFNIGNSPYCVFTSLQKWIFAGGDRYIAFRKDIGENSYFGWIKVHVLDNQKIILKEYAINYNFQEIEINSKEPVIVYPNPVTEDLFVSDNQESEIRLYNLNGELINTVTNQNHSNSVCIEMKYLPAGIYYIRVITKTNAFTEKIVKM